MQIAAAFKKCKVWVCCSAPLLLLFFDSSIPQDSNSPSLHHSCDFNEDVLLPECIIVLITYRDYIIVMIHEKMFFVHITPSL